MASLVAPLGRKLASTLKAYPLSTGRRTPTPPAFALDAPGSSAIAAKIVAAYGADRWVESFSGSTVTVKNNETSAASSLGFDSSGAFSASSLPTNSDLQSFVDQKGSGIPLSLVSGSATAFSRSGTPYRFGTTKDSNGLLTRTADLGGCGVNLGGVGSLVTGALPIVLSGGDTYAIVMLWSPNNRKLSSSSDTTDPVSGGNNTRENLICYGTNSNNQMIAYLGGGASSDFARMQAGGQQNQTSGKGSANLYRFKANSQYVTAYVFNSTSFKEIESGKITKSVTLNAATTTAIQGGSMDNGVIGVGAVFSSTSTTAQGATNRGDIVFGGLIVLKNPTDAELQQVMGKATQIGQQHLAAPKADLLALLDEYVDFRDTDSAGRVVGKNSKLTTDFNVGSGLFSRNYSIPSLGVTGLRSTGNGTAASYQATDNYFADVIEGTVIRMSFWESNSQNANLAQDLVMGNGNPQQAGGGGESLMLGYHHNAPAFGALPSNSIDTLPRMGSRRKADLTLFGSAVYDGTNQTLGKYNYWAGHLPMVYGEVLSSANLTQQWWETGADIAGGAPSYALDAPVINPVPDKCQYPFKPNQLQLHIATFAPPAGYNPASPDPAQFVNGTAKSYVSGGGLTPFGHMDGSISVAQHVGVRHATSDHKVQSSAYQYQFQGTRVFWGFAKRQLNDNEIAKLQVNSYKLVA